MRSALFVVLAILCVTVLPRPTAAQTGDDAGPDVGSYIGSYLPDVQPTTLTGLGTPSGDQYRPIPEQAAPSQPGPSNDQLVPSNSQPEPLSDQFGSSSNQPRSAEAQASPLNSQSADIYGQSTAAGTKAQAMQQLGITPSQVDRARSTIAAQNGITADQMQKLCTGIGARRLTPEDIDSMAPSLGISGVQRGQLRQCAIRGSASTSSRWNAQADRPPAGRIPTNESSIEASFHSLVSPDRLAAAPNPARLEQFGYALFTNPVSTFAPMDNAPVSDDYLIGPSDELNVLLWGRLNRTLRLRVERDGAVQMPEIGPIQVAGLTFEQAKRLIEQRVDKITGVETNVTMGRIRSIQVFVIGKVNRPGLYTVSALSHVSNALVAAGGIDKVGSLRRIELRRGNQTIKLIDLYAMLLRGDTSADLELAPRDVLFVPVIGPVAGLAGNVKSPGIYELQGGESLRQALGLAGGLGAFGYQQRIQIERIASHAQTIALDIAANQIAASAFRVQDGDLVKVFGVLPDQHNVVTLKGNVRRPGSYEWRPGMTVAGLVGEGEGVADRTYFDYALIRRVTGPDRKVHFLPVNLARALRDSGLGGETVELAARDELTIYREIDLQDLPTVSIEGAVRQPGKYPLSDGMRLSDLIYEAGGLKSEAYLERAQLARTQIVNGARTEFAHIDVDLRAALKPQSADDPQLLRGDDLLIQNASNWHAPWRASVVGEVVRPGPYPIHDGEHLSELLRECGGYKPNAFPLGAIFIRQSVRRLQQRELDDARERLETDIARLSLMPRPAGGTQPGADTLAVMQNVLAQNGAKQAVGRVAIQLNVLDALANSPNDVVLENQDAVIIPQRPVAVQVLGEVYSPNAIVYQPGLTVQDYLQRAGGAAEAGDVEHLYVVEADGEVLTEAGVRGSEKNRYFPLLPAIAGGLMGKRLGPGDTIYVPEKLIYTTPLQYATDITRVIANSAASLAVLGILATSL